LKIDKNPLSLYIEKFLKMKLLNPLFDTVFKFLMEDVECAKGLIKTIIKKDISELYPLQQEASTMRLKIKYSQIGMIRQDYVAMIKSQDEDGKDTFEKVVIEVQKSPFMPEIGRFRNYLADKYKKKTNIPTSEGSKDVFLAIKTIYLIEETFNKNLPPVLARLGQYYDELENTVYEGKRDEVVELFNHDSWFIQTELLPPDFKQEMMYVLSVFAPTYRKDRKDRYIEIPDNEMLQKKYELLNRLIRRLQMATSNTKINRAVDVEMEYEDFIEKQIELAKIYKEQAEQAEIKVKEETKKKNLAEKKAKEERKQKELAEQRADDERKQKELAEQKADEALSKVKNLVLKRHQKGMSKEEIAEDLEMKQSEVDKILKDANII